MLTLCCLSFYIIHSVVYKLIHELVKSNSGATLLVKHFSYHVGVIFLRDKIFANSWLIATFSRTKYGVMEGS